MMKKKLIVVFCLSLFLSAGSAMADMYELDHNTALTFREITSAGTANAVLESVFDISNPPMETVEWEISAGINTTYAPLPWLGSVGFVGSIRNDGDWIRIGADGSSIGDYTGFRTFVGNDNDDIWNVRAFANAETPTAWVELVPGEGTWLELTFSEAALTTFGIDVMLDTGDGSNDYPSEPDFFHVSVVPVPGAVLLGILGLGAVGIKLRKYA